MTKSRQHLMPEWHVRVAESMPVGPALGAPVVHSPADTRPSSTAHRSVTPRQ
ncbi:hypothetical protein [Streptomyces sp. 3330]|uniref:hypothetical protein n=1 Tax=Streptomyces sp. 3330 TaxID=2817755 RepID=UPI00286B81E7|nr:hypothetical protein [Streptomyces sp. 3330]